MKYNIKKNNVYDYICKYFKDNSYKVTQIEATFGLNFSDDKYKSLYVFYCHALILINKHLFINELEFLEDLLFSRDQSNYLIAEQIVLSKLEQNE